MRINRMFKCKFKDEDIHKTANTRLDCIKEVQVMS